MTKRGPGMMGRGDRTSTDPRLNVVCLRVSGPSPQHLSG